MYKLEDQGYDPSDKVAAFARAQEWGDHIPVGLIYKEERPVYEEHFLYLKEMPLIRQKTDPLKFESLLDEFI